MYYGLWGNDNWCGNQDHDSESWGQEEVAIIHETKKLCDHRVSCLQGNPP